MKVKGSKKQRSEKKRERGEGPCPAEAVVRREGSPLPLLLPIKARAAAKELRRGSPDEVLLAAMSVADLLEELADEMDAAAEHLDAGRLYSMLDGSGGRSFVFSEEETTLAVRARVAEKQAEVNEALCEEDCAALQRERSDLVTLAMQALQVLENEVPGGEAWMALLGSLKQLQEHERRSSLSDLFSPDVSVEGEVGEE
jgi:hypothetical protein